MPEIDTSLYARPTAPPDATDALGKMLGLATRAREFRQQSAVRDVLQQSADPNDPSGFNSQDAARRLIQHPDIYDKAGAVRDIAGATQGVQGAEQAKTATDTIRLNNVQNMAATLLGKGNKLTDADINQFTTTANSVYGNSKALAAMHSALAAGASPYEALQTFVGGALGATSAIPSQMGTVQSGEGMGAPAYRSAQEGLRAANGAAGGTSAGPGPLRGNRPGLEGELEQGSKRASELVGAANDANNQRALLSGLRSDLAIAGDKFGPWAKQEKMLNALSTRLTGYGITATPGELAAMEGFDKIGTQLALRQAGALHMTNETLSSTLGSNPTSTLSKLGNQGILNLLEGMNDSTELKGNAWLDYRAAHPGANHDDWSRQFNRNFDPRVMIMRRMNGDERTKYLATLGDRAKGEIRKSIESAERAGWVPPRKEWGQ